MILAAPPDPVGPAERAETDSLTGLTTADRDPAASGPRRASTLFVVTAARRLGALAKRRRGAFTAVGTLLAAGVLVLVLAGRWGQFAGAAAGAPWWMLAAAVALQIASLLARSESWNVCVHAAGATVDRRRVYRAAGVGYAGSIVNGELGFALRIAALKRGAPTETPRTLALAATEIPIVVTEVSLAALFSFTLVAPLGLPWWTPLVSFGAILAAMAALARLSRRHPSGWWQGLSALSDLRARARVATFVALAVTAQIARNWMMLRASGVHASLFDATAVLIALAALGVLPIGPGVGATAMVLILGANGVADVSAAGVLLTATGALGALAYGGWALTDRLWTTQRTTRLALHAPTPSHPPPPALRGTPLAAEGHG